MSGPLSRAVREHTQLGVTFLFKKVAGIVVVVLVMLGVGGDDL